MADSEVSIRWTGEGMRFHAAHDSGNDLLVDGDGQHSHSPVQALLLSLAGCTAADVVDITRKMRVDFGQLLVDVEGDRNAEPPRYFTAIRITYRISGLAAADESKLKRAIELSHEKYCSVLHSLRKDMLITSRLVME